MEKWVEIRRKVLANEASKRAICREYKIHWDTLQRILTYPEPPKYEQEKPREKPKIGKFLPIIHEILKNGQQVHRKQRHTAKRIFARLRDEHHYEGGYTGVKDAGVTWTDPAPLNLGAGSDSGRDVTPQVTTDALGNWVAVWSSTDSLVGTIGTDEDILFATFSEALPLMIIDDGDPGYSEVGSWIEQSGPFLGFHQDTAGINPLAPGNGDGVNTASWTFDVEPGYVYELAACWLHFTNRATNARYKLRDQVGAVVENEWWRFVGQKNAPNEFDDQGEDWRILDTFSMTGDRLVVELSDLADGWVLADAMRLVKLRPIDVEFIDDEDAGYVESPPASWNDGNDPLAGFKDDVHYLPGTSGNTATWTATVDVGSTYEVAATWYMFGNRATNAPYVVTNGANTWNLTMDQTQGKGDGDYTDQGEEWFVLADVGAIDPTLTVELTATGDGLVFADAIRLMKKELAVEVTETDGLTLVSEDVLDLTDTYEVVLTAAPTANVQIDLTSADGQTTARDSVTPANAFLTFTPANWSVPQTVLVTAVDDVTGEGSHTGLITHSATSADTRYAGIGIDSVTSWIVDNDVTFDQVVDNGQPVFFEKTGRGWPTSSQGYDGDSTFSGAGGGFDTATWTFTVQPGFDYDVSANWFPFSNRATNAPYTITAGINTLNVAANQQVAPGSFTYNSFEFETLGTIGVPLGTHILTVQLTDLANGLVIADAIHISQGAAIPPPASAAPPADDPVALSDLDLEFARWIVASEDADSADDGDAEEDDLAAVDFLYKVLGDE